MNLSGRPIKPVSEAEINNTLGIRSHALVVISFSHIKNGHWYNCQCDCGNIKQATKATILSGRLKSCGCYRTRALKSRADSMVTHKCSRTRLYNIWSSMRYRCNYPSHQSYENYGGRGIRVCQEWSEYQGFHDWAIANGYDEKLTIDRIDNDGDYAPLNCKWSSRIQQQNNRRNCKNITINGVTLTAKEWSRLNNIKSATVYSRLRHGWDEVEAVTLPV